MEKNTALNIHTGHVPVVTPPLKRLHEYFQRNPQQQPIDRTPVQHVCPHRRAIRSTAYLSAQACATRHNPAPHHILTRTAREKVLSALRAHKRHVTSLPELRKGAAPLFYLHPEGLAQTPRNWRRTILRDTYGFSAARKRINSDRDASRILSDIKNANTAEK
eukprot:IDg5402t1